MFSANDTNFGYGISGYGTGNMYFTGYFEGTTDFDPSAAVYPLTSSGGSVIFVLKFAGGIQAEFPWTMFLPRYLALKN